jgi:hypothetical protein
MILTQWSYSERYSLLPECASDLEAKVTAPCEFGPPSKEDH